MSGSMEATVVRGGSTREGDFARVFVVNLKTQPERRISMLSQLAAAGLHAEFVEAVDGRGLPADMLGRFCDQSAAARIHGRELTRGEIGCALSHIGVYRRMVDERISCAVILEDDARLGADFLKVLKTVETHIAWEQPEVYLFSHVGRYSNWRAAHIDAMYKLVHPTRANGGQGYLLTLPAAAALLAVNFPVRCAIDSWIRFRRLGAIRLRAVVPYCVGLAECEKASTIEPERRAAALVGRRRSVRAWISKYLYEKIVRRLFVKYLLREVKQPLSW